MGDEAQPSRIRFHAINAVMRDDFRVAVVTTALEQLARASTEHRRALTEALRRSVRVDGFTKQVELAPLPMLKPATARAFEGSSAVAGAVLAVWAEVRDDLRRAVTSFLGARAVPTVRDLHAQPGFLGTWSTGEMSELTTEFLVDSHYSDRDDVALMMCWVTGRIPISMSGEESARAGAGSAQMENAEVVSTIADRVPQTPVPGIANVSEDACDTSALHESRWPAILADIADIPAEASDWELLPDFMAALQRLAARKQLERDAPRRELELAMGAFSGSCRSMYAYFGLGDDLDWDAERPSFADCRELVRQVRQVEALMLEHGAKSRQTPATAPEARQHRRTLDELEARVVELIALLNTSLRPAEAAADAPTSVIADEVNAAPSAISETTAEGRPMESASGGSSSPATAELAAESDMAPRASPAVSDDAAPGVTETVAHDDEPPVQIPVSQETSPEPPPEDATRADIRDHADAAPWPEAEDLGPLMSASRAAEALSAEETSHGWHRLLFALLGEDDLSGAYWLARSLEAQDRASALPAWLLAAAQASRWVSWDSEDYVANLRDIATTRQPHGKAARRMALAAALRAALVAPDSGLGAWLETANLGIATTRVVEAVGRFSSYGPPLRPSDLLGVVGAEQRESEIRESAANARRWLKTPPHRLSKMKRASDVWARLAHRELRELLTPIAEDRRGDVTDVRSALEPWKDSREVLERIAKLDLELTGRAGRPIVGDPRDQLVRWIGEACSVAQTWIDLAQREDLIKTRGTWLFDRVHTLQSELGLWLPRAAAELHETAVSATPAPVAAVALCLQRTVREIATMLRLPEPDPAGAAFDGRVLHAMIDLYDLERALACRLLWLPEITLTNDGLPSAEALRGIAVALRDQTRRGRTLLDACEERLARKDFRFRERFEQGLAGDLRFTKLFEDSSIKLERARAELRAEVRRTEADIEQAVVDGIISESERTEHAAGTEIDVDGTVDFPPRLTALQRIRGKLESARQQRLEQLLGDWHEIERVLGARDLGEKWSVVRQFVQAVVERTDTRLMYECLERLRQTVEGQAALPDGWVNEAPGRDSLAEFLAAAPRFDVALGEGGVRGVLEKIRAGQQSVLSEVAPPADNLKAATTALLEAWLELKARDRWTGTGLSLIGSVLQHLGFILPSEEAITVVEEGPGWAHVRARMSDGGLSPVPQFGSQARGIYDVLCVRDRPGADVLSSRLSELRSDDHPVIVIYIGRLAMPQRRALNRLTGNRHIPVVVLDETLVLFLASSVPPRLSVFFEVTLPFSAINPFTPFQAGDVPPEMFYGRNEMALELQRREGACLVYGGRQLGKSALLRHVQRALHDPDRQRFARVVDIKLIGEPQSDQRPDELWTRVRDILKEMDLLPRGVVTRQAKEIVRHIRELMTARPQLQTVLLFDEADNFLDADAREGFQVVTELRTLMNVSERRFKVVFAGLQNVQRFQGIANQPLAHFGRPQLVGPLEPDAAENLITKPFHVLGFRFPDPSAVLRILSFTNYHPGLIQLFCQELLRATRTALGGALPPYEISPEDIERVYRQPSVRNDIRERFDWTLALDPRYQCVAWAMIQDQMQDRDGYARPYAPAEILNLARYWWRGGFQDATFDRMQALLDEMCGLGVLVRTSDGQYRLRSPNLVRLMGREADIESRLLEELSERPPVTAFDADSHRAALDRRASRYSPFTFAQERSVLAARFGVALVFGSPALGIADVPAALARALNGSASEEQTDGLVEQVPATVPDGRALREWPRRHLHQAQRHERLAVFVEANTSAEVLAEQIEAAAELCQERGRRSRRQSLRVVFVLGPSASWQWLNLPGRRALDLEVRVDATVTLGRWNAVGLRRRLEQHEKISMEPRCARIMEVTGGWPALVDDLFQRCGRQDDPQRATEEIKRKLNAPDTPLAHDLVQGVGLDVAPPVRRVLQFVRDLEEVDPDDIVPDIVEAPEGLSDHDCRAATEFLLRMSALVDHGGKVRPEPVLSGLLALS